MIFDGADLHDTDLSHSYLDPLNKVCLDGARLCGGSATHFTDCSVRNADLSNTRLNPAEIVGSDFSGARLAGVSGSFTVARDTIFRNAHLCKAGLGESKFPGCDFAGADLTNADLGKCDFTGANFNGANLTNADLPQITVSCRVSLARSCHRNDGVEGPQWLRG